jgi:hypothetical protein
LSPDDTLTAASISAYALIAICRLLVTPNEFKDSRWSLGSFAPVAYVIAFCWNVFLLCVSHIQRRLS